jgi:hypothetical protein
MKPLLRLHAYLIERRARRIRRDAIRDYQLAMLQAERLERASNRLRRRCRGSFLSGKGMIAEDRPERVPWVPERKLVLAELCLERRNGGA